MATPRKRSSGFTKPAEEVTEKEQIEGFLDAVATETFETISRVEEEVEVEEPKVVAPPPKKVTFIPEEIIPTEDAGPRFVEAAPQPVPQPKVEAPVLKAPPKRHPRNVPRFSARK
jgi:hypothetical protein